MSLFREETRVAFSFVLVEKAASFHVCLLWTLTNDFWWAELVKIWKEVFSSEATPIEYVETLDALRPKYGLKEWHWDVFGQIKNMSIFYISL